MSWIDDLKTRAEQSISTAGSNITDYLGSFTLEPVVKTGSPAGGNQTAAQIAAGHYGRPAGTAAPSAPAASIANSQSVSMFSQAQVVSMLPMIAVAVAAYFFLGRKSKG